MTAHVWHLGTLAGPQAHGYYSATVLDQKNETSGADVQSVWAFARVLAAEKGKGKRQLDCAGVVTTTLAVCQRLSLDPQHADLAACRFQVGGNQNISPFTNTQHCAAQYAMTHPAPVVLAHGESWDS